jgi:hypothetical protein
VATHKLKVMADYYAFPVWDAGGSELGVIPDSLAISTELRSDLLRWAAEYDALADTMYSWPSPERETEFAEAGFPLAQRLQAELGPTFEILYFDCRTGELRPV